jgi:hypothetical protein
MSAAKQVTPETEIEQNYMGVADEITCAVSICRDLIDIALDTPGEIPVKTDSILRAALRYVDDIEGLNARLFAYLNKRDKLTASAGGAA